MRANPVNHGARAVTVCFALVAQHAAAVAAPDLDRAQVALQTIGVPFVPNAGQWDREAAFAAKTLGGTLFVTTQGRLVYSLPPRRAPAGGAQADASAGTSWSLVESFVSATGEALRARPSGHRPVAARVSYFTGGDASRHRAGLGAYERVNLGDVFEGVNVQLRATGSNVEKIFTVAPFEDPGNIHVRLAGATRLELGGRGELIAHTGNGPVTYTAPIAFQEDADGTRRGVDVRYDLDAAAQRYAFALGDYDRTRPLVIDPLLQSTYLGGGSTDIAWSVAVHPRRGEVYVAGQTSSTNFPTVAGAFSTTKSTGIDGFISLLSSDLKTLKASTYLGGTGDDVIRAIAIHPSSSEIYVAGWTTSDPFPQIAGFAYQSTPGGGRDGFVARVGPFLDAVRLSTYLGGSGNDEIHALAIHPHTGHIYVMGTAGAALDFPSTAGASQTDSGGGTDVFVSRLSDAFDAAPVHATTLLGGSGNDEGYALAIDPRSGDVFVGGATGSPAFPGVSESSAQPSKPSLFGGFVTRLAQSLTGPPRSTYLTAGADDTVQALAVHGLTGEIIAAGTSSASMSGSLPGTSGSPQPDNAGLYDAFIIRLTPALDSIRGSTYLGGTNLDYIQAVAVHPSGEIIVAGYTLSPSFTTAPSSLALQPNSGGGDEMFVARYTADLAHRTQLTYLGAGGSDQANALAIAPAEGDLIVAGFSSAAGFPGTAGSPVPYGGAVDAVVSRLTVDLTLVNTTPAPTSFIAQSHVAPLSLRTSSEIRMQNVPVFPDYGSAHVDGPSDSQLCATTSAGCCTDNVPAECPGFVSGWFSGPYVQLEAGDYLAVRHTAAASGTTVTRLLVGGKAFPFVTSTGNAAQLCNLDVDADHQLQSGVEGIILMRAMFGMTGTAVTAAVGPADWSAVRAALTAYGGIRIE
jgi:hypothetical protein